MSEDALNREIQELREKNEVLIQLTKMSTDLTSQMPLNKLLQKIMDATVEVTQSEAASVLLWNNVDRELFFAATTSTGSNSLIGTSVPMDSVAGTILRENRIIEVADVKADPRHYDKVDEQIEFQTRSLLGVPMTYKDKRIGVLEAVNKKRLPWTDDDRYFLQIIAAHATVVIEDAQMVMELKKANQELSQLDKLKNDFIAIVSHELRTPLGVIMGYASFLQEETSEEAREHASKVVDSALHLRSIIEAMINLRYLKQSQNDLAKQRIPLADVFQNIEYELSTLPNANRDDISVVYPPEEWMVEIDSTRFSMAIMNLLTNALLFTPEDGSIKLATAEHKNNQILIAVEDTGKGIASENLERIFEDFFQVEDHMTRHVGGLGIGLCIARAIVEAHGGRLWAESPGLGQGATFKISIPLA